MSELYGSSAADGDDPAPPDASHETNEADKHRETPDSHDTGRPGEDEEPLSRGEYADMMHEQAAAEEHDSDHRDGDGHDDQEDPAALEASDRAELAEPRTRQEVTEEADRADQTAPDHDQADDADLDATVAEEDRLPEPRTRQEVADEAWSGNEPLARDAALPEHSAGNAEKPPPLPDEQHDQDQRDNSYARLTIIRADAVDRTLADTTPTGIGLKPTGDQLLGIESDDVTRNRTDRLIGRLVEGADDLRDGVGESASAIEADIHAPTGSGHMDAYQGQPVREEHPMPETHGTSDAAGAIVMTAIAASAGLWRLRTHLRRKGG